VAKCRARKPPLSTDRIRALGEMLLISLLFLINTEGAIMSTVKARR